MVEQKISGVGFTLDSFHSEIAQIITQKSQVTHGEILKSEIVFYCKTYPSNIFI